jgi:hypothetical protein
MRTPAREDEYRALAYAFDTLIGPHVDATLAKAVMAKQWLPERATRPQSRPGPERR